MKWISFCLFAFILSCTRKDDKPADSARSPQGVIQANQECQHTSDTFHCVRYIKNYDADTVTVQIPNVHPLLGDKISVRVNGIDSAEMKSKNPCERTKAREAQKLVEKVLRNAKRIDLKNVQRDKYFRVLADVSADGRDLKQILFENALGYEYHGDTKQEIDWCKMGRRD